MNEIWDRLPPDLRDNPLFAYSAETHYVPAWSRIKLSHIKPAFDFAIEDAKKKIAAIRDLEKPITYKNTLLALQDAMELPGYLVRIIYNHTPERAEEDAFDDIVEQVVQGYYEFFNGIFRHDDKLYKRLIDVWPLLRPEGDQLWLKADKRRDRSGLWDLAFNELVHHRMGTEPLPPLLSQKHDLYDMFENEFLDAGIESKPAKRARMDELDRQIVTLELRSQRNMKLADRTTHLFVNDPARLIGLSDALLQRAAKIAAEHGRPGEWAFGVSREDFEPFMQSAEDRDLRHDLWQLHANRATDGPYDNRATILELGKLSQKRARMLGHPNVASQELEYTSAGTIERVGTFLKRLSKSIVPAAAAEIETLRAYAKDTGGIDLHAWDVMFYSERMRKHIFGIDEESLREYFPLKHVLPEIFAIFKERYGVTFRERPDIKTYHPDVKAYEVRIAGHRKPLGIIVMDLLARDSKPAGTAWDVNIMPQGRFEGAKRRSVDLVVCKFKPDEDVLLSFFDVTVLFHEIGHAMHNVLSDCEFPDFSGYYVEGDFVEFPSQFEENFCWEPEVVRRLTRHHKTGRPLEEWKIANIFKSRGFMAAHMLLEDRLRKSVLDHKWYTANLDKVESVEAFEEKILAKYYMFPERPTALGASFSHMHGGGYEAKHYSYLWSQIQEADAFGRLQEEGILSKTANAAYRRIPQQGNTKPSVDLFREFRGRAPDEKYFYQRYGLQVPFYKAVRAALTEDESAALWDGYGEYRDGGYTREEALERAAGYVDPPPFLPVSRAYPEKVIEMPHRAGMEDQQPSLFSPPPVALPAFG